MKKNYIFVNKAKYFNNICVCGDKAIESKKFHMIKIFELFVAYYEGHTKIYFMFNADLACSILRIDVNRS